MEQVLKGWISSCKFRIRYYQRKAACGALRKALQLIPSSLFYFFRFNMAQRIDAMSLGDLCELHGWRIPPVNRGDVDNIEMVDPYCTLPLSDYLFGILAPYVKKGSFIYFVSDEGKHCRWLFNGRNVRRQLAQFSFTKQIDLKKYVYQSDFFIHSKQIEHARILVRDLAKGKIAQNDNQDRFINWRKVWRCSRLTDQFDRMGWLVNDDDGHIDDLRMHKKYLSCEDVDMLAVLAPCVQANSVLIFKKVVFPFMHHWCLLFDGKQMIAQWGDLVWENVILKENGNEV